jgi:hypothetical protein
VRIVISRVTGSLQGGDKSSATVVSFSRKHLFDAAPGGVKEDSKQVPVVAEKWSQKSLSYYP